MALVRGFCIRQTADTVRNCVLPQRCFSKVYVSGVRGRAGRVTLHDHVHVHRANDKLKDAAQDEEQGKIAGHIILRVHGCNELFVVNVVTVVSFVRWL